MINGHQEKPRKHSVETNIQIRLSCGDVILHLAGGDQLTLHSLQSAFAYVISSYSPKLERGADIVVL